MWRAFIFDICYKVLIEKCLDKFTIPIFGNLCTFENGSNEWLYVNYFISYIY